MCSNIGTHEVMPSLTCTHLRLIDDSQAPSLFNCLTCLRGWTSCVFGWQVALVWNVVGDLEVSVSSPQGSPIDYSALKPELRIRYC